MAELTSRQRVLRAIAHQETDRLPRDFAAEEPLARALLDRLGLPDGEALRGYFGGDMETFGMGYHNPYSDGRNIWGCGRVSSDLTTAVVHPPLTDAKTVEDVARHPWPSPDWADIEGFRSHAIAARKTGRAVVASSWGSIFGEAYRLMGMDGVLQATVLYPDVVVAIIRRLTDFFLEVDRRAFIACDGLIDLSFHGNDFGSQRALLMSRPAFQRFFAGHIKELIDQAHTFGLRAMYHSCGAVSGVIPDLIAAGVDVLDPVQFTAAGMEPAVLKARFGAQLTFHGCISAQKVLPLGTPEEVRAHVKDVCETMRPGGGYIFVSDQWITRDTPPDNVIAMYKALDELGY